MKPTLAIAVCLLFAAAWPTLAGEPVVYRYYKELDWKASGAEQIVAFTLDSEIYAATRDGWPDLRIFGYAKAQSPMETPYKIEPVVERREDRMRHTRQTEIKSLKEAGKAIEIRLRLPEKSPAAEGFNFSTPLRNFERIVRVAGSDDGETWTPLVGEGLIFDYSRYMDVNNYDVPLPANSFRQYKITIEDVADQRESPYKELTRTMRGSQEAQRVERTALETRPLRIERIDMIHYTVRELIKQAKKADYPIVKFKAVEDADKKQTIIEVHTRREPLTSFVLETPNRNFSRRASVQVEVRVPGRAALQPATIQWREIGGATISKLQMGAFNRQQLEIAFPEYREKKYRIVIDNEDNPLLDIQTVKAQGNVYRAAFVAQDAGPYRVFYGSETALAPKYEADAVLGALGGEFQPIKARLGAQTDNAKFGGEPSPLLRKLLNNWIFLGAAIALMVVVLGWGLVRAGGRLDQLPKE